MKNRKSLLLLVLPLFLLASCGKDEEGGPEVPGQNGDITFEIGFAPQGGAAYAQADGSPQTRVLTGADFRSAWEDGDEIGVFAVAHGQSLSATAAGNYIHNVKLTYSGGTWTQAVPLYWRGNTKLDFYAYYPYDAGAADPTAIAFNVQTDQRTASGYNKSDLLTAKSENTNGWAKGSTVTLAFAHALAMVQVSVPSPGVGFGPGPDLTVTLRGVKTASTLNLAGPAVSAGGADRAVKMYRVEQPGGTTYTYRALVPAQAVAAGNSLFLFEHEGRQLLQDGALGSALSMTAGQAETFTRTLPQAIHTVKISAGTFQMGEEDVATPVHEVMLTQDFHMSKYQVTREQYAAFLNAAGVAGVPRVQGDNQDVTHTVSGYGTQRLFRTNQWGWTPLWNDVTGLWEADGSQPMIYVTWYGAKAYADWVGGALPTEAQWEYACRAGTTTAFYFGDDANQLGNYGWYNGNSSGGPSPVGTKLPNDYGLYDMHGNVWEWCSDWYAAYDSGDVTDPTGSGSGSYRVLRGGSWFHYAQDCRSAYRYNFYPDYADYDVGFRVVFVP